MRYSNQLAWKLTIVVPLLALMAVLLCSQDYRSEDLRLLEALSHQRYDEAFHLYNELDQAGKLRPKHFENAIRNEGFVDHLLVQWQLNADFPDWAYLVVSNACISKRIPIEKIDSMTLSVVRQSSEKEASRAQRLRQLMSLPEIP